MRARDEASSHRKHSDGRAVFARYSFAVAMSVVGFAVTAALYDSTLSRPVYAPLIGVVALTVWYGGIAPGLVAIALCWTATLWLLVEPRGDLQSDDREQIVQWGVGLVVALVVVGMSEILRHSRQRATTMAAAAQADVRRLESLNEVAAALAASVSSTDVARALTTAGAELVSADGAAVALVDGDDLLLEQPAGVAASLLPQGDRIPLAASTLLSRSVREGALVRADGRRMLEATHPRSVEMLPTVRVAVAAPLRAARDVVGALGFLFERDDAVGDDETALVETMAGLAGQALERARLYEREREWRQSLDRILQIAPRFHAESDEEVLAAICREARTAFGADYGLLWRLADGALTLLSIEPNAGTPQPGSRYPLEDFPGLLHAVDSLQVSFVPDVLDEARGAGLDLVRGLGVRSSLRTPIAVFGRAGLVLAVSWQTVVSEPDRATIAIARRLADQAGLALEQLERRRAEARAALQADETRRLQEVTAALSLAATPLDVSTTCLEHALRTAGAKGGFVVLLRGTEGALELVSSSGYADDEMSGWRLLGADSEAPFARALTAGDAVWDVSRSELGDVLERTGSPDELWIALPLRTAGGVRGALQLSFEKHRELTESERRWLLTLVSQCAQALERSSLYDEEQLLRSRAERAQSLSAALSNALTRADVAQVVADEIGAAVGADGAALAVVVHESNEVRVLGWRGYADGEEVEGWHSLRLDLNTPGNSAVRRRKPVFLESRDQLENDFPDLDPALLPAGHESFLFVPLVVGRRASGLLTLSWAAPAVVLDEEIRYVEFLAGQAAQALERATHFESERTIAETLQRSVLPASLPSVDGLELAARYLPGTAELDVGGDWFDALRLADGRVGLVVGDVVGKGVYAAASMGQLRNALRAFTLDRLKPASALARLNRLAEEVLETTFATIVYLVIDPVTGVCRLSVAGHPPPLVAYPDGRVELLEGGRGLPLGTGIDATYRQDVVRLPAGSTLLLYTDGLVERRDRSIDDGIADLRDAVREGPSAPERLLEHVLERLVGGDERGDDVALLAARLLPVAPQELDLTVSRDAGSFQLVRDALRTWLAGTPLGTAESEGVLLAAWEAFANACEHAVDPAHDLVRLRAKQLRDRVTVVVEDSGKWRPPTERPDRGLGLRLMRSASTSVDVVAGDKGTRVTIEKSIIREE